MIKEEEILADEDVNERESEELINEITNESGKKGRKRKKKKGANVDEAKRQQIAHVRNLNKIYVNGSDISNPIENFHELKISQKILDNLDKTGKLGQSILNFLFTKTVLKVFKNLPQFKCKLFL